MKTTRKLVCDHAVDVLRRTNNSAVMWGDSGLLHAIAEAAGMPHNAWVTEDRVLAALRKCPGDLIPGKTLLRGHWVLIFRMPV